MSDTLCPVFCISKLPNKLVNKFFQEANRGTDEHSYENPVGFLVTSTGLPEVIEESATTAPIDEHALDHNPFLGKMNGEVVRWALDHFHAESGLLSDQMVILDERSGQDDTCLLLSLKESVTEPSGLEEAPERWIAVRSDFESAIVTIMTKATGCGGDQHFETSPAGGYGGILRISESESEEWEAQETRGE